MWSTAYEIRRNESPEANYSCNYNTLRNIQDCLFCPDVLTKNTSNTTGMRYEEYVYWPITDYTVC